MNSRGVEEFIAVVFGNEVWMGLVDFKSDKPPEEIEEEIGTPLVCPHGIWRTMGGQELAYGSERYEEEFGDSCSSDVSNPLRNVNASTPNDSTCL